MKLHHIATGIASLMLASLSFGQLTYTNEGPTSLGAAARTNAHDLTIFDNLSVYSGGSFSLESMPELTFNDITGTVLPNEFALGDNGSFNVSMEVAFLYRNAIDHDQLLSLSTGTTLFDSSDAAGLGATWKIGAAGLTSDAANWVTLKYSDLSTATSATMFQPNGFKVFLATDAANYNYYIFGDEDRTGHYDGDFNDFTFIARINTGEVGFTPVPEPSTYGLIGGLLLTGLAFYRRRVSRN